VSVHLDRTDGETVRLVASDTGKGLPPGIDLADAPSLGLRLVSGAVTRELGGTLAVERSGGTRFIIQFKCDIP
jgi:two-component sensor histidine kinase